MTVPIVACCTESEGIGVVIASSSIGAASLCAFVRTGAGAALMGVELLHSLNVH